MLCKGANTYIINMIILAKRLTFIEAVNIERRRKRGRAKGFCCRETQPSAADLVNPAATPFSSLVTAAEASSDDGSDGGGGDGVGGCTDAVTGSG